MPLRTRALVTLALLAGCSAHRPAADASRAPADAGPPDVAVIDATPPDAAPPDAALPITVPEGAAARPLDAAALARWRADLGLALTATGAVGWSSALVIGEAVVDRATSGVPADPPGAPPLTPATARPIGSLSRLVTALLVAALIEEGHLDWSAPATRLRPDWKAAGTAPTLAEMACGCFGVDALPGTPPQTAAQVLDRLKAHLAAGDTLEAMPTPVLSAAAGYLAALGAPQAPIEPAAAYADQVAARIARPLEIGLTVGPPGAGPISPFAPDRGGWASLDDLAKLAVALVAEGATPTGGKVVEGAAMRALLAPFDGQRGPATRAALRIDARGAVALRVGGGLSGRVDARIALVGDMAWVLRVEGPLQPIDAAFDRALDDLIARRYGLDKRAAAADSGSSAGAAPADAAPATPPPDAGPADARAADSRLPTR